MSRTGNDVSFSGGELLGVFMERAPTGFAVTHGPEHVLVYANAAFRRLATPDPRVGRAIHEAFRGEVAEQLHLLLDEVVRTGIIVRDRPIGIREPAGLRCTVWPDRPDPGEAAHLFIELRRTAIEELASEMQREVAERMLLSALRERDVADQAVASSKRSQFLAAEGTRLSGSLDEARTLNAISHLSLPQLSAWCIVDLIDPDGSMRRLAIIHPDPAKQTLLNELEHRWVPQASDAFGAAAVLRDRQRVLITREIEQPLTASAHDAETRHVLHELGAGALLTVPLIIRDSLVGAVTFVGARGEDVFTEKDIELAEELAVRSALALDSARLNGETIALKVKAEAANQAKSDFLGTMSHELRTPLNAIGGYLDLIDMGLRGPVTDAQHADLARIRHNQRHLLGLISDILNFIRIDRHQVLYHNVDVRVHELIDATMNLVEPLLLEKQLRCDRAGCDPAVSIHADPDKVTQILVNLLSNAIKFTPRGGMLVIGCEGSDETVSVHVTDTGIGIPSDKLEVIFEPFVQVKTALSNRDAGVGLGLAISRDLARAMNGNLTVESTVAVGSRFTLDLPRAEKA